MERLWKMQAKFCQKIFIWAVMSAFFFAWLLTRILTADDMRWYVRGDEVRTRCDYRKAEIIG
jgi:hypothetical protein